MQGIGIPTTTRADNRRVFAFIAAAAMVLSMIAVPAAASGHETELTVNWEGNGYDSIVACEEDQDPYFHWILTTGGNFTIEDAELSIEEDSYLPDDHPSAAKHFYTDFYGEMLENGSNEAVYLDTESFDAYAEATYVNDGRGRSTPNPVLTISDGCFEPDLVIEALLSGVKFLDRTDSGTFEAPDDDTIDGWDITIYDYADGVLGDVLADLTTADGGQWSYNTGVLEASEIDLLICEEQRDGWEQTGPLNTAFAEHDLVTIVDDEMLGGDALGTCYRVQIGQEDNEDDLAVPGLNFGNVAELLVNKTADTAFDREHDWTIDKSVDPDALFLWIPGQGEGMPSSGTATWTIDVTYEGYDDDGHTVSGTVTVKNPTGFAATIDSITDTLLYADDSTEAVDLDCGEGVTFPYELAAGTTLTCDYSVEVGGEIDATNSVDVVASDGFLGDSATAGITWGDPENEAHDQVNVVDTNAGFALEYDAGENVLNAADYDEGDEEQFTYSDTFSHGDFDECDPETVDNTTSVIDGEVTLDSDTASLDIHIQCEVFGDGETAWAANGTEPGSLRYNDEQGNWATYTTYADGKTGNIYAGQDTFVGTYTFTEVADGVEIAMTLTGGWMLNPDTAESVKIQGYNDAPSGNPSPGNFTTYKGTSLTVTVDAFDYYGIHLDVGKMVPDPDFGP